MSSPIHFYLTFNPYLNKENEQSHTQAHEFFEFLEDKIKSDKDSYAYWGKMIGKNRTPNIEISNFQKVIEDNLKENNSTHLYITDFNHLWVGKVVEVTQEITKKEREKHTLSFYKDKNVEVWFKVSDFTLLEHGHDETALKLSELYIHNEFMDLEIDGLSPFTTGIKYPAFVQDLREEAFFDETDLDHLILQFNPAINNTQTAQSLKAIHTYVFSEQLYSKIPHAAKIEIESAELDMLEQRHHNPGKIAFSYIKALEIIVNDLVIHHIKRSGLGDSFFVGTETMPPKLYFEEKYGECVSLSTFHKNFSINQVVFFAKKAVEANHLDFRRAFANKKPFLMYLTKEFSKIIDEAQIIAIRGVLAHNDSSEVSNDDCWAIRNIILGIGHLGLIHGLYQNFYPELFKKTVEVKGSYKKENPSASSKNTSKRPKLKIAS